MPHPEEEHGLRVQLATALRERDGAIAERDAARDFAKATREALAAANARADAAEANALAVAQERIEERASRERNWDEMKEALAAARLEIEELKAKVMMHELARSLESSARTALATPAAASGEEGTR